MIYRGYCLELLAISTGSAVKGERRNQNTLQISALKSKLK
jgi:hypothetical protein